MSVKKILKGPLFKPIYTIVLVLLVISLLAACTPTPTPTSTGTSGTTVAGDGKPYGELVTSLNSFGGENWLPWQDAGMASLHDLVYDLLIYWDHVNEKFLPGLAERWEVSPDAMTTTFHLRKGVQYHDGWGEFTSADVKFNWEMQASPKSTGKVAQTRKIASMETPDPYTIIVNFKEPYPMFYVDMSMGNSGVCQGFVSKKYYEEMGEVIASQKPIGTGPYKLIDSVLGNYYRFEGLEEHWRVVPEFKYLRLRLIGETSSIIAALKNKEIDVGTNLPADQLRGLKAAGLDVESSPVGGYVLVVSMGGMINPEDHRYDPNYHNKDPWVDPKVRKAMALAIDREGISKAMYDGLAFPIGVPFLSFGTEKYQYPYDPAAARELLKEAGYENGFSFKVYSYATAGSPEIPRVLESLVGFWTDIGLKPQINIVDLATYKSTVAYPAKSAGSVAINVLSLVADQLGKAELYILPGVADSLFQDEASLAIYNDNPKMTFEERNALLGKLNEYYFENVGPIPVVLSGYCYAWNPDKVMPFPHPESSKPTYLEYARHATPLNTFSLWRPWPDR